MNILFQILMEVFLSLFFLIVGLATTATSVEFTFLKKSAPLWVHRAVEATGAVNAPRGSSSSMAEHDNFF